MAAAPGTCPYVGLQPYTEPDRDYFFGRERDQQIVVANLYAAPLTILYGESGVGKSSLLLAGVVPALRTTPRSAVVVFREWQGAEFLEKLKRNCLDAFEAAHGRREEIDSAFPLDELLCEASRVYGGSAVVLLDQFDEYFLYHPDSRVDAAFETEFARAVNREDVYANFLVVLREDALSKLDRFRARIRNLLGNTLRLQHLDLESAEAAIRKPLEVFNSRTGPSSRPVGIEDGLVHEILRQVQTGKLYFSKPTGTGQTAPDERSGRIETPFLQLVLTRLWDAETKAGSSVLRLGTFEELGGAAQIVRSHMDGLTDELNQTQQEVCARLFDRLVTPGGTKIAYTPDDLGKFARDLGKHVNEVIAILSKASILRSVGAAPGQPGTTRYEIFHDVLAPAVLDWRTRYMQRSEEAEAERRAKEQQRRAEEKARAEEQAKSNARLRRGNFALAIAVLLAVLAGSFAVIQWWQAEEARKESFSRELVSAAARNPDPEFSVFLARLAVREKNTLEAESALRRALRASPPRLTLSGHAEALTGIAIGLGGTRIATASADGTAKLWDAESGEELRTLAGHEGAILTIAFSPDGKRLATAGSDKTAKLWDAESGKALYTLAGHEGAIYTVTFSPDGGRVATASEDQTAKLWDAESGRALHTLSGHKGAIYMVTFSPDGRRVATASEDKTAKLWDSASGTKVFSLEGHAAAVRAAVFSPDGSRLATASWDRTAKLWETNSGRLWRTLTGHRGSIHVVVFSPDGSRLATASRDTTAKLWDMKSGRLLRTLTRHRKEVDTVVFSPDNSRLATADKDGSVKVWRAATGREIYSLAAPEGPIGGAAFNPDGDRLAIAGSDGTARIWDFRAGGGAIDTLPLPVRGIKTLVFSRDGKNRLLAVTGGRVKIWDADSGKEPRTLELETLDEQPPSVQPESSPDDDGAPVAAADRADKVSEWDTLESSPDGTRLATAGEGMVGLWDMASGSKLHTLTGHEGSVNVTFSPDGTRLATGDRTGAVKLWDASSGQKLWDTNLDEKLRDTTSGEEPVSPAGDAAPISAVAFSPDGSRLATADGNGTVKRWDSASGRMLHPLFFHGGAVNAVAFSPDGVQLATAGSDKTTKLWDTESGNVLRTLTGHGGAVEAVAFSVDGTLLATAGKDGTVRLWDTTSGKTLDALEGYSGRIALTFNPDGLRIATADLVASYPLLSAARLLDIASDRFTRLLTTKECEDHPSIAVTDQCRAALLVHEARDLAAKGDLERSRGRFLEAARFDPNLRFDVDREARRLYAQALRKRGKDLLAKLKVEDALGTFREAQALDATLADPVKLAAKYLREEGSRLAGDGFFREDFFRQAAALDPDPASEDEFTAKSLAVRVLVRQGTTQARSRKVEMAAASFRQAKSLDPNLPWEPDEEAKRLADSASAAEGRFAASRLLGEGRNLARQGKIKDAELKFEEALKLDPTKKLDPEGEARRWAASRPLGEGRSLAMKGELDAAAIKFEEARELDPTQKFNPRTEAKKYHAQGLVGEGARLAMRGKVKEGIRAYARAQKIDAGAITASSWNNLCWHGSLWGYGREVMHACNMAVNMGKNVGAYRDSRGVARALADDSKGALLDFTLYVDWGKGRERGEEIHKREEWIRQLKAGKNPFDDAAMLQTLRQNELRSGGIRILPSIAIRR